MANRSYSGLELLLTAGLAITATYVVTLHRISGALKADDEAATRQVYVPRSVFERVQREMKDDPSGKVPDAPRGQYL